MKNLFFIIFFISLNLFAEPKEVVFIFLSEKKVSFQSFKLIIPMSKLIAKNEQNCIPMGNGCFNPQKGFIDSGDEHFYDTKKGNLLEKKKNRQEIKLRTFNSMDVSLVDCEKGNYFDIFCGKAKDEKNLKIKGGIDLFVDISSSMKQVDDEDKNGYCERRYFVSELLAKCKNKKISVYGFDTKKINGVLGSKLCVNYGLNDRKNAVRWIKNSDADYLLAITDLEEYQGPLREYLDKIGAKLYGLGVDDFMASKLKSLIPSIEKKYCVK